MVEDMALVVHREVLLLVMGRVLELESVLDLVAVVVSMVVVVVVSMD
jgi:hypothetical protein